MKKICALSLLMLCFFIWTDPARAAVIPPDNMLSAQVQEEQPLKLSATLYFRYRSTGYLAREIRELSVSRTTSDELALINALVEGPGSLSPQLSPLFPAGTQALSTAVEGETLFITFNEQILGRYADEAVIFSTDYSQGEGRLRRRLAMAALVNTLTESGLYSKVQVLVRQESYVTSSMRLSMRYYLLEDDSLPPPLTRQESYILTPQVSAKIFLDGWRGGDFASGLRMIRGSDSRTLAAIPSEYELRQMMEQAPRLADFIVTPGSIALDGQSAVVTVSLNLLKNDGSERMIEHRPLRMVQREGIYAIPYESFESLLEAVK